MTDVASPVTIMAEPAASSVRRVVCYANLDGFAPKCSYRGLTRTGRSGRIEIVADGNTPTWVRLDFSNVLEPGERIAHAALSSGIIASFGQDAQDMTFAVTPSCPAQIVLHIRFSNGDTFTDRFGVRAGDRNCEDHISAPDQSRGAV